MFNITNNSKTSLKYSFLFSASLAIILLGAGCSNKQTTVPSISTSTTPVIDPVQPTSTPPVVSTKEKSLYRGFWFDIKYPQNFSATPNSPSYVAENQDVRIKTNEARFLSPDGTVEFFVFSPLWGGDPFDYLKVKDREILVSEETATSTEGLNTKTVYWATIKAKDNSYYRSFVSTKINLEDSQIHYVLGIKYKDTKMYETYKNAYTEFKDSLQQYAD